MYRLAVIGAGQLGSRHLQGMSQVEFPCEIYVVDPSAASLDVARRRFDEASTERSRNKIVNYCSSIEDLPESLDYVIVATNADTRLAVIQALADKREIRSLVLEKVLFQAIEDYSAAEQLLSSRQIKTWVNCPRRLWSIYRRIYEFFTNDTLRYFHVRGGMWGLGCNSVHYLDLLAWLTKDVPTDFITSGLDRRVIESKRPGFIEFTGTLQGRCGDAIFEITSVGDSKLPDLMTLRSESKTCIVDEGGRRAFFLEHADHDHYSVESFDILPMSRLSTSIVEDIVLRNLSGLASYSDSAACHIPFIEALSSFSSEILGTTPNICRIT